MTPDQISVVDGDGHLIESISELAEFMDPGLRAETLAPVTNRQGVFPSLDGLHYLMREASQESKGRARVTASEHRAGSGEDWSVFLQQTGIQHSIIFTTEGLSVGLIQRDDYAVRLCRAYNDWIAERYRRVDRRLHPMALIPMQNPKEAALELRRAVKELDLPGAMIPSTGLPLHAGHEYYFPVYEEASQLDCVLAMHGGSNRGLGMDSFSDFTASHVLHHPLALMIALTAMVCHGVLDQYPTLRLAFLEAGCAWLICLLDRMARDEEYSASKARRLLPDYFSDGQILIGCEGDDESLGYLVKRLGSESFAYSSDYPHEVDLIDAQRQIQKTKDRPDLSVAEKAAVLGGNARRFYRLQE